MLPVFTVFRLIRLPNVAIIAATLVLVRYCVVIPVLGQIGNGQVMSTTAFIFAILATVLIAAGGYVLNDCYDIEIDRINHPQKQIIGNLLSRTEGIVIASALLSLASIMGLTVGIMIRSVFPVLVYTVAIFVCWWYAKRLKRSFLWGNLAVACMTGCTIGMIWLFDYLAAARQIKGSESVAFVTTIIVAVMIFAALLNLAREIVKDLEDMKGDAQNACKSLPVVTGTLTAKRVVISITSLTLLLIVVSQVWLCNRNLLTVIWWLMIAVELPLLWFIFSIYKAQSVTEYHKMSALLRFIMLGGMLAMVVLYVNS